MRVEPGCVLDDLNHHVRPHGLSFAPDISTANRATIGGMIANNSSGTHSLIHGKTIDHVLELTVLLADGSVVEMKPLDDAGWKEKCRQENLEGAGYRLVRRDGQRPDIQGGQLPVTREEPLKCELVDFVSAVRDRRPPRVTGEDGRRACAEVGERSGAEKSEPEQKRAARREAMPERETAKPAGARKGKHRTFFSCSRDRRHRKSLRRPETSSY